MLLAETDKRKSIPGVERVQSVDVFIIHTWFKLRVFLFIFLNTLLHTAIQNQFAIQGDKIKYCARLASITVDTTTFLWQLTVFQGRYGFDHSKLKLQ